MAIFNINLVSHRVHAFLQRSKISGLVVGATVGVFIGVSILGVAFYQIKTGPHKEQAATMSRLAQMNATIEKLTAEKRTQEMMLAALAEAPKQEQATALSAGGFSEEDVGYWRKQLSAYSMITGTKVLIVGRSISSFKNATKVTVRVEPASADAGAGGQKAVIKALDFLQLFGYVESFDGKDASVHIENKTS